MQKTIYHILQARHLKCFEIERKQFTDLVSLKVSRVEAEECRTVKSFDCANTADRTHETFISQRKIFSKLKSKLDGSSKKDFPKQRKWKNSPRETMTGEKGTRCGLCWTHAGNKKLKEKDMDFCYRKT